MSKLVLHAKSRNEIGTSACRRLRKMGLIPATLYGANKTAASISVINTEVTHAEINHKLFHNIIYLNLDGVIESILVKDVQRHPFKPLIQHLDFLRIKRDEVVTITMPLNVIGEEDLVKKGLVANKVIQDVEVSCLPSNLPEQISVDLSDLEAGDMVLLKELNLGDGVEIVSMQSNEEAADWPVIVIDYPALEEADPASDNEAEDTEN
ncbi:50S ribosomal protein L25 [Enterovibrio nigricans]|uniref:Large ribosomal subunit protein bL25 n=1 Tax=Enterovibrio nigricans DSM 22720 TaxID=1121868 RepID=A0A1T4V9U6_9GAMM|nr:50S ribosomal protein L25 [Enterovibrio nigricans]PKF50046.1 50S ribosomal protein L25 [Enterovibrio nigricans]SKA61666.1 large subunit ribosomal protein L25 [Enterovibrio nigricans DSM 22720]